MTGITQVYRMNGNSGALRTAMMDAVPSAPGGYPVTPYNVLTNEGKNADGTVQMNVTREQAQDLAIHSGQLDDQAWTDGPDRPFSWCHSMRSRLRSRHFADGLNFYSLLAKRVDNRVDPPLVLIFDPSKGEGIDVGFKFDLIESKLSGSVAFFDIDRTNILQSNPLPEPPAAPTGGKQYAHQHAAFTMMRATGAQGLRLDQSAKNAVSITGRHTERDSSPEGPITVFHREWAYRLDREIR